MKSSVLQVCNLQENASQKIYIMLLVAMLSKISQTKVHSRFNGENVDHAFLFRQIELVVINNFDFFDEQFEILARFC